MDRNLKHLITVAGHAIPKTFKDLAEDSAWWLESYQAGEGIFFVEHIRCGIQLAIQHPDALLLFSGTQSRSKAGPCSEAQGYHQIAAQCLQWLGDSKVGGRASTEEFARDSFENLLFSICRFKEWTGRYPEVVTIVSWAFKQQRFELHRQAIRFPHDRFRFEGANDPPRLADALSPEEKTRRDFITDPYGAGPKLNGKRKDRNPFLRQNGYASSCPELADLLQYAGPELFTGRLPWD